jgi:DNA end-binding protein Ku
VPTEQVDPIMFDRSYYLEPDSSSPKAYVLLRDTLARTDRTAIVQFALRQKTRLAALRVRGDVLVLQTLLWEDEVREAKFPSLDEKVRTSSRELEMSSQLVKSFESDFEPGKFTDEYQAQLRQLIDAKLAEGDAYDTEATFGESESDQGGEVLDLMEALRRSVESNRAAPAARSKGASKSAAAEDADEDSDAEAEEKPAPKKRAPAKKAPAAKKPAARSTAKKESADEPEPAKKPTRRKTA